MPKSLFCLFLMLFSLLLLQAESFAEFRNRLMEQDWKTAEGMIKDFLSQSKDLEAMRELQDLWRETDPEACRNFFFEAQRQKPGPDLKYRNIRVEEEEEYLAEEAYKHCIKLPEFY